MTNDGIILFVDDDIDEHDIFRQELQTYCNRKVKFANDGEEALAIIEKNLGNIFLIVSDIHMPKLTGLELKRTIEGRPEIKLKAIPFVFHTSSQDPVIIKEAFSLGIQGYILKTNDYRKSVNNLRLLIEFWDATIHPRTVTFSSP